MILIKELVDDLFTDENNLYFSCFEEEGENTRYFSYNESVYEEIGVDKYFMARYGENYNKIIPYFGHKPTSRSYDKEGSMFVCFYQESKIYKFDIRGNLVRIYSDFSNIDTIYDIAVYDNSIWCTFPTSHTIKKFSLTNGREELSISEFSIEHNRGTIFCYPERILIYDDKMYVVDMGNKRICIIDLNENSINDYIVLPESITGYERLRKMEFVLLDSGLYLL